MSRRAIDRTSWCRQIADAANVAPGSVEILLYSSHHRATLSIEDIKTSTVRIVDTRFNLRALKEAGFRAEQLREAGFDLRQLAEAGFDARHLKKSGYSAKQLREVGLNFRQLRSAGFSIGQAAGSRLVLQFLLVLAACVLSCQSTFAGVCSVVVTFALLVFVSKLIEATTCSSS